jgi:putative membrane protein
MIAAALALPAAVAFAEEPTPRADEGREAQARPATHHAAATITDNDVVHMLLQGNQGEIASAKLAEQHSQNERVRQFAQQMIQDHGKFMRELRKAAGMQEQNEDGAAPDASGERRTAPRRDAAATGDAFEPASEAAPPRNTNRETPRAPAEDRDRNPDATAHAAGRDWASVSSEICHRKQQMCLRELEQKQGAQFDKAYIGGQIGAHTAMAAELEVLSTVVGERLRPLLTKGLETTREHLKHAKSLMQELDGPQQARVGE